MNEQERNSLLADLRENRERLLAVVNTLSAQQLTYRAADPTWSVADCVEHIATVESFVLARIQRVLEGPAQPEKRASAAGKLEFMNETVPGRDTKFQGPDFVHPKRQWSNFSELVDAFNSARDRTIQFAGETRAELHDYFFPHPAFGELDCHQWLVLMVLHCERHVRQMEEVMAHSAFPASRAADA